MRVDKPLEDFKTATQNSAMNRITEDQSGEGQ